MAAFPCPCCGHSTFPTRPGGSWQLCEVCCFEDAAPGEVQLLRAQESYARCGAADPELVELCRAPRPDEAPPPWFSPILEEKRALLGFLRVAFGDTALEGGVSLAEAELIDDYRLPARSDEDPPPPGYGQSGPWQALTREDLERYHWCNFSFQDARGLRYHIPAYIRLLLTEPETSVDGGSLLFLLEQGHQLDALEALLTPEQSAAIARYLALVSALDDPFDAEGAARALKKRWGRYLEPERRAVLLG